MNEMGVGTGWSGGGYWGGYDGVCIWYGYGASDRIGVL